MSLRPPLPGDVVQRFGAAYAVTHVRGTTVVLCPILTERDCRHRSDVEIVFPDTMYLGLNDGAVIRCSPVSVKYLVDVKIDAHLSSALLSRVKAAIGREMDAQRSEGSRAKYSAYKARI